MTPDIDDIKKAREYRERMNKRIEESGHKPIQRFFALDRRTYMDGALDTKTKELLGLVASTTLRCNDCIFYHLERCIELGYTDEELYDALNVAMMVGGSIIIPHLRFAFDKIDQLREG